MGKFLRINDVGNDENNPQIVSGSYVKILDGWDWAVSVRTEPGSDWFVKGWPREEKDPLQDFIVEVLADHATKSDFQVRFISPAAGNRWINRIEQGQFGIVGTETSMLPFQRGAKKAPWHCQFRLEPAHDDNRFYVVCTNPQGNRFFLQGWGGPGNIGHGLLWVEKEVRPEPRVDLGGGQQYRYTYAIEPRSDPKQVSWVFPDSKRVGNARTVPDDTDVVSDSLGSTDLPGGILQKNPSSTAKKIPTSKWTYSETTQAQTNFHWDVGIKVTATVGFDIGTVNAEVSVEASTNFGGGTLTGKENSLSQEIPISGTTIGPGMQQSLTVYRKGERRVEDYDVKGELVTRHRSRPEQDRYPVNIRMEVATLVKMTVVDGWSDDEPIT